MRAILRFPWEVLLAVLAALAGIAACVWMYDFDALNGSITTPLAVLAAAPALARLLGRQLSLWAVSCGSLLLPAGVLTGWFGGIFFLPSAVTLVVAGFIAGARTPKSWAAPTGRGEPTAPWEWPTDRAARRG